MNSVDSSECGAESPDPAANVGLTCPAMAGCGDPALQPNEPPHALHRSVRRHALGWLVAANTIGLWLAALLLWPDLNDLTAPFTYGRWVPLHLDWQLYGWCALPLVGALFRFYFPDSFAAVRAGRLGLWLWTVALAYAGATWLAGGANGKLFINFAGSARVVWSLALLGLWVLIDWQWL